MLGFATDPGGVVRPVLVGVGVGGLGSLLLGDVLLGILVVGVRSGGACVLRHKILEE